MSASPPLVKLDLEDLKLSATAALFEGKERAGIDITMFVVRTPPGKFVELHVAVTDGFEAASDHFDVVVGHDATVAE